MLLNIVRDNKLMFTQSKIEMADIALRLQGMIGWTSTKSFKDYIRKRKILNCPMSVDDVVCTLIIYEIGTPLLKGRTTREQLSRYKSWENVPIRYDLAQRHPYEELYLDQLTVNKVVFFHMKGKVTKFSTIHRSSSKGKKETLSHIRQIINLYTSIDVQIHISCCVRSTCQML